MTGKTQTVTIDNTCKHISIYIYNSKNYTITLLITVRIMYLLVLLTKRQVQVKLIQKVCSYCSYPTMQGTPSAVPRTLASFIIQENSDPIFLLSEVGLCEPVSSWETCCKKHKKYRPIVHLIAMPKTLIIQMITV